MTTGPWRVRESGSDDAGMNHPLVDRRLAARTIATAMTLSLAATSFATTAQAAITKPFEASSTLQLSPGIDYAKGTMRTTGGRRQSVRVATIEPWLPSIRLKSVLSNNKVVRREVVTRMGIRTSRSTRQAMVSTNGDMSTRDRMDAYAAPQSMAVSNGELLLAQACTRPTLGIDPDGGVQIGDVRAHVEVRLPGRTVTKQVHRVNTHRDDGKVVLFTQRFAASTRTRSGGREVVLKLADTLRPNGVQQVEVVRVRRDGDTKLRTGQAVLSVNNRNAKWVYELRVGQKMDLTTQVVRRVDNRCGGTIKAAAGWSEISEAVGGNHFTLRNSRIAAPSRAVYAPSVQRHPRSGVGVTEDGRVLMITVDGRQSGYSVGVTLAEMGQLHAFTRCGRCLQPRWRWVRRHGPAHAQERRVQGGQPTIRWSATAGHAIDRRLRGGSDPVTRSRGSGAAQSLLSHRNRFAPDASTAPGAIFPAGRSLGCLAVVLAAMSGAA